MAISFAASIPGNDRAFSINTACNSEVLVVNTYLCCDAGRTIQHGRIRHRFGFGPQEGTVALGAGIHADIRSQLGWREHSGVGLAIAAGRQEGLPRLCDLAVGVGMQQEVVAVGRWGGELVAA